MERDLELGKQAQHAFSLPALLPCCDVMNRLTPASAAFAVKAVDITHFDNA